MQDIEQPITEPEERADPRFWLSFAVAAMVIFVGAIAFFALGGLGGVPGTATQAEQARPDQQTATSPSEQKQPQGNQGAATSGAAINTDRKGTK